MARNIAILIGHPDPSPKRFARAIADAYANGARENGYQVHVIDVGTLTFPLLQSQSEWKETPVPAALLEAARTLAWADHILIIYPLWLGDVPAKLKGFFEQVLRPMASSPQEDGPFAHKPLAGKSVRIVVTMGMPAWFYRWIYGAHSLKSLTRSVLAFVGAGPIHHTLFGMVERKNPAAREALLESMRAMGRRAG
jgi:putative NADPH-quinone reductase